MCRDHHSPMVKQHVQHRETDEREIYKQNPEINAEKDAQKSNFPAGINMLAHDSDLALRVFLYYYYYL